MHIPARHWQYITKIAHDHGLDPVDLFEAACWQLVERGLDYVRAQDEGCVDIAVDPAVVDMLDDLAPGLAVFAHTNFVRVARALQEPTAPATFASTDGTGRFGTRKSQAHAAVRK